MSQDKIFIGVGANIAPYQNVKAAILLLAREVKICNVSTFYRTKALFRPEQDDYLNGVIEIASSLPPERLKTQVLHKIEKQLKRERKKDAYAPRTIDLDLILYQDVVMEEQGLVLPDPDIRERWFIAAPLYELAPGLTLPDTGETLSSIVKGMRIPKTLKKIRFSPGPCRSTDPRETSWRAPLSQDF